MFYSTLIIIINKLSILYVPNERLASNYPQFSNSLSYFLNQVLLTSTLCYNYFFRLLIKLKSSTKGQLLLPKNSI